MKSSRKQRLILMRVLVYLSCLAVVLCCLCPVSSSARKYGGDKTSESSGTAPLTSHSASGDAQLKRKEDLTSPQSKTKSSPPPTPSKRHKPPPPVSEEDDDDDSSGDDDDQIDLVDTLKLTTLLDKWDHLAVFFYPSEEQAQRIQSTIEEILHELENIDDDTDDQKIKFVKCNTCEDWVEENLGIDEDDLPVLVYFEKSDDNEIPYDVSVYGGDLLDEDKVLDWLVHQKEHETIENINRDILYRIIEQREYVAVLFYTDDTDTDNSDEVQQALETIDDELNDFDIHIVKIDDPVVAKKYKVRKPPGLVYFRRGDPIKYEGKLTDEKKVLDWLTRPDNMDLGDSIERINRKMLERWIEHFPDLAVFFYSDEDCKQCEKVLHELEEIDDDADQAGIKLVKVEDAELAREYGIKTLPGLVLFENGDEKNPTVYVGDMKKGAKVLEWLIAEKEDSDESGDDDDDDDDDDEDDDDDSKDDDKDDDDDVPDPDDKIDDMEGKKLTKMIASSKHLAVYFYKDKCKECDRVLKELERIDTKTEKQGIFFIKTKDEDVKEDYGVTDVPALIYFEDGTPSIYEDDLDEEDEVLQWLLHQKREDTIETVNKELLDDFIEDHDHLVVFFHKPNCANCDAILTELEHIDDDTDKHEIQFIKCSTCDDWVHDNLGIASSSLPIIVFIEKSDDNEIPFEASVYGGDLLDEDRILAWVVHQKETETIENINRELLFRIIDQREYLAVVFSPEEESGEIIEALEMIDDDLKDFGIHIVKIDDPIIAKKYKVRNPPGMVYFRRGNPVKYEGRLTDDKEVLEWLTRPDNMDLGDSIERINRKMLARFMQHYTYLAVYFYSDEECKQCERVLEELEQIDDDADKAGIKVVKVEDFALARDYGIHALPGIVFFKKGHEKDATIYAGDMKKGAKILEWLNNQKDPNLDKIEDVDGKQLRKMIAGVKHLAVYFYDPKCLEEEKKPCDDDEDSEGCDECDSVLSELEAIDSETDKQGISFVKTQDSSVAQDYGVTHVPALLYFESGTPSVFEGDLSAEEDVLQWLVQQRTEDTIESVNRELLDQLIESTSYLVVYFYKPHCRACDVVLEELEHIDDECDLYGIQMVKIQDLPLAKRYGIKTLPALIYFRNGNPLLYDGDLRNEDLVLEWLVSDENRELEGVIEEVNEKMLAKLINDSPYLAVLFYSDDEETCPDCEEVLDGLEEIDEEVDSFGIDLVKCKDPEAARAHSIFWLPTLALFRRKTPILYDLSDLKDQAKVLEWLTSNEMFELKDEIEEVNRKLLEKLMDQHDYIAVYFYSDECVVCDEVLHELEHIDDEAGGLDIMFVKMRDARLAKKYELTEVPGLIYFRRRFPSVYRGDLLNEEEVLEWLRKNRYRHSELSIFMYAVAALSIGFVFYTAFYIYLQKKRAAAAAKLKEQ